LDDITNSALVNGLLQSPTQRLQFSKQSCLMKSDLLNALRVMADPTRLRLHALLEHYELSVNEIQEITQMGQSRISTHLAQLQKEGFVQSRREGKRVYYGLSKGEGIQEPMVVELALKAGKSLELYASDSLNLTRIIDRRQDQAKEYFNQVAGRFDRQYGPGRSWQAFGQLLLRMMPALDIADLGSGEGLLAELLALNARSVIAVDNSQHMVDYGTKKAMENGLDNLEFRLGDLVHPPIDDTSRDVVILSQALHHATSPMKAIASAFRILRPGGRLLILDLLKHDFSEAKELYGDHWLGFDSGELMQWLQSAGFAHIDIETVAKEEEPPYFQTVLAAAIRP
jgi:ubiquinone/menaquinone biosynthesis C-methylase UbiE/DNA-binding transcriptional ArsR family regulator